MRARRRAREQAWAKGAAPERITLDFDATLVTAHSEKERAAGNFKGGFGFHPLAVTALQGLRDVGKLKSGRRVLINGASGGVGTFAVQIAKSVGADVTGVCSSQNVGLVQSLGADHLIDYTREDFTKAAQRYNMIFDNAGNHSISAVRRALAPAEHSFTTAAHRCAGSRWRSCFRAWGRRSSCSSPGSTMTIWWPFAI
jgi:NADPH:quinone reductase-like Zn-dependent oxidoreductase